MAKRRNGLKSDTTGQYYRQIGYKLTATGTKTQPKFRIGRDRTQAEVAYHRLGALWDVVVEQHQHKGMRGSFAPPDAEPADSPLWTGEALQIAEAIRKHQHTLRVGQPDRVHDAAAYVAYMDYLRQQYGHLIQIVPADTDAAEAGREQHRAVAQHRARQTQLNARIAEVPIPTGIVGTTLYQAFDEYATWAEKQNAKESGKVEAANARRLKHATHDMDLGELGYSALEAIKNYWVARPEAKLANGKKTGRPISLTTVDNHLSTARRFVRWLDRSDAHKWELPRHGEQALKANLKRLRTDQELASQRHGVQVFTVDQLVTIWKHATDFERLLVALGLNAAMQQAEIISLRWDEVEDDPPAIKRIRRKSGVYGEFAMWPETVKAIEWWRQLRPPKGELVMTTGRGNAYTRQRISNQWTIMKRRIERETGQEPASWLPFKHLRKTAGQLVRNHSNGEIAGVFLSHGQPVATDELSDVYTNRPFHKVAEALEKARQDLEPVFRAAPTAFQSECIGRG